MGSPIDIGKLSKPADTLIKKISSAVGWVFEPYQITRIAKAEAKADLIRAESSIQITDLHRRAMHRFVEEEAKKQENMEAITSKALPLLNEKSAPSEMDNDWIANFFEKARLTSDSEMQDLWARILAGEANCTGSFSKRTIQFVASIDKREAELFQTLLCFSWNIGFLTPIVFDINDPIYKTKDIDFRALTDLDSIGLVRFDNFAGFAYNNTHETITTSYFGRPLELTIKPQEDNELHLGKILLTQTGKELAPICITKPIEGFFEYVMDKWKKHTQQETGSGSQ